MWQRRPLWVVLSRPGDQCQFSEVVALSQVVGRECGENPAPAALHAHTHAHWGVNAHTNTLSTVGRATRPIWTPTRALTPAKTKNKNVSFNRILFYVSHFFAHFTISPLTPLHKELETHSSIINI